MMFSEAERAERERSAEVDRIAAKLIRDRGMSLWQAIHEASRIVKDRRTGRQRVVPMMANDDD